MFSKKTMNSFSIKYDIDTKSGCWVWNASTARGGYGQFFTSKLDGRVWYRAHRFSYEAHNGPITEGLVVMHSCDNCACVNPDHLSLGTQADNIRDRESKGRGKFKVTLDIDHASVKVSGESDVALSKRYGCSAAHIWKIRNGKYARQQGR